MSRPTLQDRLAPLFADGLIHAAGVETSVGGRPAELIRFDDRHLVVLTFDIGHTHLRVTVSGVRGQELRCRDVRLDITNTPPGTTVDTLIALGAQLLAGDHRERLVGVGVGLPGPVSPVTGLPGPTAIMPGWEDYPVLDRLRAHWPVPMVVENDARALVLGEATRHPDVTVLGLKWSNGIGAGLVTKGRPLTGDDGAAGDIGHVQLSASGPPCRCGRRGCLAAYASGHALRARFAPAGSSGLEEIIARAAAGDAAVCAALDEAGRKVGTVLAALIALTNPRVLVIGGAIGRLPRIVDAVSARVRDITLPRSTESLQIVASGLGVRAGTVGLVHLVVERVFSPDAVDRALAAGTVVPAASRVRR